ncbi:DUF2913 family protein [Serratia sp. JSRIV001]|uniref:DUF2913 family protein n=1 Tax=unclassified Serratia (in: enterobacteria) TaxID=2647522 RepID=UPI0035300510
MLDKTESVTTENTTSALSHLAFCALVALGLARQDGIAGTPYAENLFLIRWLATAQKQKRFPRSVAIDIQWLLERGRKHGPAGKRFCRINGHRPAKVGVADYLGSQQIKLFRR